MLRVTSAIVLAGLSLAAPCAAAVQHSPYAHHHDREITSLSAEEVADLLAGEGAGLALPAELNGYPGPKHVIELADSLRLSPAQRALVQTEYDTMRDTARRVGRELVDAERVIDSLFRTGHVRPATLQSHVERASGLRARLRLVHLTAHMRVREMLDDDQVDAYQRLRGYN